MTSATPGASERARELGPKEKQWCAWGSWAANHDAAKTNEDFWELLQAGFAMHDELAAALAAAQQPKCHYCNAATATTCSKCFHEAEDERDALQAQVRQLEQALNEESYAQCACTQEYEDMRAELERLREQVRQLEQERPKRIECASCHKAPTDDPSLVLHRVNVKGVPGVFLCRWCVFGERQMFTEREQIEELNTECERLRAQVRAATHCQNPLDPCRECIACLRGMYENEVRRREELERAGAPEGGGIGESA